MDKEQTFYPKDFEHLFLFNPDKMTIDEIVNYLNSCSNKSDKIFIYNAYYFMLKRIPNKEIVVTHERAFGDPRIKEGAKRDLITNLKSSSEYCDVWLLPQERFVNYLRYLWQVLFSKIKPRKYDYVGFIDVISKREIAGWVINRRNPEEKVMVDIYCNDNEKKLSIRADAFREDLKLNGVGDGFHAIYISPVPEELLKSSFITLKTQNDNTILTDNTLGIFREVYEYTSFIDTISKQKIVGWVINLADKEERVMVDIYGDNEKKLSVCANIFREDLKMSGLGDGFHGIYISPVPEELLKCSFITLKTQKQGYILIDDQQGQFRD